MKVLLSAREIPFEAMVTKRTGEKKYILKETVRVYGDTKARHLEIKTDPDTRFLMAQEMAPSIAAISADTELIWEVSPNELYAWIYEKYFAEHK